MNLLLLLSALLTALGGASVNVRTPQVPVAVNRIANVGAALAVTAVPRTTRPIADLPALADVAVTPLPIAIRLVAVAPLYLSRRRE